MTGGGGNGGGGNGGGVGAAAFSAVIDGLGFASNPLLIGGVGSDDPGLSSRAITGISILNGDTTTIVISITFVDPASFVTGQTFTGGNGPFGDFAFGYYGKRTGGATTIDALSTDLPMNNATLTITGIDTGTETWSGTFSFDALDDDTGIVYSISAGVFSNIEYD